MWEPGEGGCGELASCSPGRLPRCAEPAVGRDKAKQEEVLRSSFLAHHKSQLATGKPPPSSAPATLILQRRSCRAQPSHLEPSDKARYWKQAGHLFRDRK